MKPEEYENESLLASYRKFAEFLVSVYGQRNSIVIFKTDPGTGNGSVIYSNTEEYKENDKLGELAKKVLSGSHKGYNYLINISDETEDTAYSKKSSYFLIRNSKLEVIGIFWVFFEVDYLFKAKKTIDQILGFEMINNRPREYNDLYYELENDEFSITKYASGIIASVISEYAIPAERLTIDEKGDILRKLEKMDIFHIKGSVQEAAQQLMISTPTIYRIMKSNKPQPR